MASRIVDREVKSTQIKRAIATQKMESIRVPLWFILEDTKPENTAPMKKPNELIRKIDPAWPVEIFSSSLIVGSSGEKINRLMNVRKKTRVRYRILQNIDWKVSGIGQDLSDIKPPLRHVETGLKTYTVDLRFLVRHARAGGHPFLLFLKWIPAFAGMTVTTCIPLGVHKSTTLDFKSVSTIFKFMKYDSTLFWPILLNNIGKINEFTRP
jgi:hypothetical protein